MKKATDVGLQTWEADVTCGVWCQGGSVRWLKTDHPQYTDASDVWVRGDDAIAALEALRAELADATAWRPISTAPTEGRVLLWRAHGTVPIVARFDPIYGEFEDEFGDHVYGGTHWMPLPAAPNKIDAAMAGGPAPESAATATRLWGGDAHEM